MGAYTGSPARQRSILDAILAILRRPVRCGRWEDAVIDRAGLTDEASPLKLGFRDKSDDIAHGLLQRSLMKVASRRRCELYASGRESGVSSTPRATPVTGPPRTLADAAQDRRNLRRDRILLKDQGFVMEATTRIELVYTVLQTVA